METWEYAEQILYVDLTRRTARVETTAAARKRSYVGGAGFVASLLAESAGDAGSGDIRSGDARSGDTRSGGARVALAAGPLSDGMAGRLSMGAAPAPGGRIALSSMGGRMAAALKSSGYDAVVIEGELDRPGVLLLEPDGIRLLDAGPLWGEEVPETERRLFAEAGPYWASMVLGPAAENAVPFATLAHEGHYAGGSGVACALGGKRLKALMVRDAGGVPARCTGCTLACPAKLSGHAQQAGDLGLDAPTAKRITALAAACAAAGMLPRLSEPLREIAHRRGLGALLAQGEAALLERLGPEAVRFLPSLPPRKKRGGVGVADLLGTCQRVWRERPGEVLRSALAATQGLLATAG